MVEQLPTTLDHTPRACEPVTPGTPEETVRQAADVLREVLSHVGHRRHR